MNNFHAWVTTGVFSALLSLPATAPPATPPATAAQPTCHGKAATIVGTAGVDKLTGTPHADVIVGLTGPDRIDGLGGDDTICGGAGLDRLVGGAGDDLLHGGSRRDSLLGSSGDDRLYGGGDGGIGGLLGDILVPGPGDDVVRPGFDRRQLRSSHGRVDTFPYTKPDAIVFHARRGVVVRLGDPHQWGTATGEGRDRIRGQRTMWIVGTLSDDVLVGGSGDETMSARTGEDELYGMAGRDILYDDLDDKADDADLKDGGSGDDQVYAHSGPDHITGGTGDDYLFIHAGKCIVVDGSEGADEFELYDEGGLLTFDAVSGASSGSAGEPACGSATSYDALTIDSRGDTGVVYTGTDGADHVTVLAHGPGVVADLLGGDDSLTTGAGDDVIRGGAGLDTVNAGDGNDTCLDTESPTGCETTQVGRASSYIRQR